MTSLEKQTTNSRRKAAQILFKKEKTTMTQCKVQLVAIWPPLEPSLVPSPLDRQWSSIAWIIKNNRLRMLAILHPTKILNFSPLLARIGCCLAKARQQLPLQATGGIFYLLPWLFLAENNFKPLILRDCCSPSALLFQSRH